MTNIGRRPDKSKDSKIRNQPSFESSNNRRRRGYLQELEETIWAESFDLQSIIAQMARHCERSEAISPEPLRRRASSRKWRVIASEATQSPQNLCEEERHRVNGASLRAKRSNLPRTFAKKSVIAQMARYCERSEAISPEPLRRRASSRKWRVIASEAKQSPQNLCVEGIASPAFGGLAMTNIGRRPE